MLMYGIPTVIIQRKAWIQHEYSDFVPLCTLSGVFGSETDAGNDGDTYSYCRENEENTIIETMNGEDTIYTNISTKHHILGYC